MHRLYQLQNINGSCHYHHSRKWGVPAHAQEHRETLRAKQALEEEEGSQKTWVIRTGTYPLSLSICGSGPLRTGPKEHLLRKLISNGP